jgi:uncharacterized membrane protein
MLPPWLSGYAMTIKMYFIFDVVVLYDDMFGNELTWFELFVAVCALPNCFLFDCFQW